MRDVRQKNKNEFSARELFMTTRALFAVAIDQEETYFSVEPKTLIMTLFNVDAETAFVTVLVGERTCVVHALDFRSSCAKIVIRVRSVNRCRL